MNKALSQSLQTIDQLRTELQQQKKYKDQAIHEIAEFNNSYIKTTISHLVSMGYIITNSLKDKGYRYIFFDITQLSLNSTFWYPKDAVIVPVDEVADKVVPTEVTSLIENSLNYCDMLLQDLYMIRNRVEELSGSVQQLEKTAEQFIPCFQVRQKVVQVDQGIPNNFFENAKLHHSMDRSLSDFQPQAQKQHYNDELASNRTSHLSIKSKNPHKSSQQELPNHNGKQIQINNYTPLKEEAKTNRVKVDSDCKRCDNVDSSKGHPEKVSIIPHIPNSSKISQTKRSKIIYIRK